MRYLSWLTKLSTITYILFLTNATAQPIDHLTLDQANQLALQNYPMIKQRELVQQSSDLTIQNIMKGFFPQFSLNGQATYQSEVTRVIIPVPGIKIDPLSKDQYKLSAEASQLLYDGGMIRQQKQLQQLNEQIEEQKVEVELYKVKERINQLFLSILFLDEQKKQLSLVKEDLQTGTKKVEAQVQQGVVLKSNLNILKAELLKADQRLIELEATRKGLLETLGLFLNRSLNNRVTLEKPIIQPVSSADISRPEIKLFQDQSKLLDHQTRIIHARNQPRASLFVQGGYGRPGLNMLKNDFDLFYIGGIRFNWFLGGFYTGKKERQLVEINKKIVGVQKETFLLNTNSQLMQQQAEIDKLQQLIASDNDIIDLRSKVKEATRAQLENGVVTTNDYLREVNAEDQARQALIIHQIQLLQAMLNYQNISGKQ